MTEHDLSFPAMGGEVRLLIGRPLMPGTPKPEQAAAREREYVEDFAYRLSRFEHGSELSRLNRDPQPIAAASPLLCAAVRAGLWAAQRSGGLVDPTLTAAIERAGYAGSRDGVRPASLRDALRQAPTRCPARPHPAQAWRQISVDGEAVRRPAGLAIDTGGTGKGLCADAVARRLAGYSHCVVDCGGDIAIGGVGAQLEPVEVLLEHPLTGETVATLAVACGGVATSGLNVRIWRDESGGYAHHLLDPRTGLPAWTGLIAVTALAATALEAETLAKMALLAGPLGARRVLAEHGGVIVHDSGEVEQIGLLAVRAHLGSAA